MEISSNELRESGERKKEESEKKGTRKKKRLVITKREYGVLLFLLDMKFSNFVFSAF